MADQPSEDGFEFWLQQCPYEMRMALIDVCDAAGMCRRWFIRQQIEYYASDLVAMAALVLSREAARREPSDEE